MYHNGKRIGLIIPCYNEEQRLDLTAFMNYNDKDIIFIFVNDGSTDNTSDLLKKHASYSWHVIDLSKNSGKAEAVRQGMFYCQKQDFFDALEWIGYWDADLAIPLNEVYRLIEYSRIFYPDAKGVLGCRLIRLGSNISGSILRHWLSRFLIAFVNLFLGLCCYDSQCGAKLFKSELISSIFERPFLSRWGFDIEIILRLKGHLIIECPLSQCNNNIKGSKIKLTRDFIVIFDIIRIFFKYLY